MVLKKISVKKCKKNGVKGDTGAISAKNRLSKNARKVFKNTYNLKTFKRNILLYD